MIGDLQDIEDIEEIRYLQDNKILHDDYRGLIEKCQKCDHKEICKGGCIAIRRRYIDSEEYCNSMKKMIDHIEGAYKYFNENFRLKADV